MSFVPADYLYNVARGRVSGAQPFSGYGERTTTGAESNVLWPNGPYAFPPAAGLQMSIVSSSAADSAAGTGVRTLDVHYLDDNLISRVENVALNGTTPVLTVAANIRFIQCMHMTTFGSGKSAAGVITASNAGTTYSEIIAGAIRCASSVRMVPAGKRLLVTSFFGGSVSGSAGASAIINLATPSFDVHDFISSAVFVPVASMAFQDGSAGLTLPCPIPFTEGQVMGMTFSVTKAATIVGSWFGWLENA